MIIVSFLLILNLANIMIMIKVMKIIMMKMKMKMILTIILLLIKHDRKSITYHYYFYYYYYHFLFFLQTMIHQLLLIFQIFENLDSLFLLLYNLNKAQFFQLHFLSKLIFFTKFHLLLSMNSIHLLFSFINSL